MGAVLISLLARCSFPDHRFVPDSEFDEEGGTAGAEAAGKGGSGGNSGQDVAGAGTSGEDGAGTAGETTAGTAVAAGTAGTSGIPAAGTSGSVESGGAAGTVDNGGEAGSNAGSSVQAGSGGAVPEVCNNSADDDGDRLQDCLDPDCISDGWSCAPFIPEAWAGPVALWVGDPSQDVPSCSDAGPYSELRLSGLVGGLSDQQWECPGCECSPPEAESVTVEVSYRSDSCNGDCVGDASSCHATLGVGCHAIDIAYADAGHPAPSQITLDAVHVSCQSSTLGTPVPASGPAWAEVAVACAWPSDVGTCGQNAACVPAVADSFGNRVCIYQTGDLSCPSGYDSDRRVLYKGATDARGCSACACAGLDGSTVDWSITDYPNDSDCSGPQTVVLKAPGNCVSPQLVDSGTDHRHLDVSVDLSGGSCEVQNSVPTGAVEPTGEAITFCCADL